MLANLNVSVEVLLPAWTLPKARHPFENDCPDEVCTPGVDYS
jgi:hypothetical protein